jgi:YD repeat-containing protein
MKSSIPYFPTYLIIFILYPSIALAEYPGQCGAIFYSVQYDNLTRVSASNITQSGSSFTKTNYSVSNTSEPIYFRIDIGLYYKDSTGWHKATPTSTFTAVDTKKDLSGIAADVPIQRVSSIASYSNFPSECPIPPQPSCSDKTGQIGYDLKQYTDPSQAPVDGMACFNDCQQSAQVLWSDCLAGSCVASVKYTYTGEQCSGDTPVDDIRTEEPQRCSEEIQQKITQCGGSLYVSTFNFDTCTGTCTPDSCADKWDALISRCGGLMAVSTWSNTTCSGTCVNDPTPDIQEPGSEAVPDNIKTETVNNEDGSKVVTQTSIYNVDGNSYTNTTTTNYDSSGNPTGTTTVNSSTTTYTTTIYDSAGNVIGSTTYDGAGNPIASTGDGTGDSTTEPTPEPSVDIPSSFYTPSYDLSQGLVSQLNYEQILNATSAFEETFLYQLPNLILDCLGYVEGNGCTYPPTISVNFQNRFSNKPIVIDMSPFSPVVDVMKFFFSLLCLVATGKAVMVLFS